MPKKIVTLQFEVDLSDKWYGKRTNSELIDMYNESGMTVDEYIYNRPCTVIAVNDTVESEKADADSTREIDGPAGLDEVPC